MLSLQILFESFPDDRFRPETGARLLLASGYGRSFQAADQVDHEKYQKDR